MDDAHVRAKSPPPRWLAPLGVGHDDGDSLEAHKAALVVAIRQEVAVMIVARDSLTARIAQLETLLQDDQPPALIAHIRNGIQKHQALHATVKLEIDAALFNLGSLSHAG